MQRPAPQSAVCAGWRTSRGDGAAACGRAPLGRRRALHGADAPDGFTWNSKVSSLFVSEEGVAIQPSNFDFDFETNCVVWTRIVPDDFGTDLFGALMQTSSACPVRALALHLAADT